MKTILLLIASILTLTVVGQVKNYEFGPETLPEEKCLHEIIGGDNNYTYLHKLKTKGKGNSHYFQKLDKKTLVYSEPIELNIDYRGYNTKLIRTLIIDDELILFIEKNKNSAKKLEYVVAVYDVNTMSKIKENKIAEFEANWFIVPDISIKVNENNTYIGMKVTLATVNPKSIITEFIVYDISKGSKTWGLSLKEDFRGAIPLVRDGSSITNGVSNNFYDFHIDNFGNVHYIYPIPMNPNQSELHYSYYSIGLDSVKKDYALLPYLSSDYWNFKLTTHKNKNVSVLGFYQTISFESKGKFSKGIASFVIDNITSQVTKTFTDIDDVKGLDAKKCSFFNIDNVLRYENVSVLVGHRITSVNIEHYDSQLRSHATFDYTKINYEDICFLRVNDFGKADLYNVFPFLSTMNINSRVNNLEDIIKQYICFINNNNLYIFHNEHPSTTKIIENKEIGVKYSAVYADEGAKNFVINKFNILDGTIKRSIIEVPEKNAFIPILQKDFRIAHPIESNIFDKNDKNIFIPFCWGDKMERFLKVTLE